MALRGGFCPDISGKKRVKHFASLYGIADGLMSRLQSFQNILCGLLTIEHAWSRGHATSSVTTVLPPPGQCCGIVCLNNFDNQTSPSDNSNDR